MIDSIEFTDKGVWLTFSGIITSKEIIDANTKTFQHQGFELSKYQLWIFNSVKDFIISAEELQQIAERDIKESERNPKLKIAIVSDSNLAFGLGCMYEAFYGEGPWETMVFHRLEEAEKWINS